MVQNSKNGDSKNEYHLIKNSEDSNYTFLNKNDNSIKEIEEIQNEIHELNLDSHQNDNKNENQTDSNMEELKVQILENNGKN